MRTWSSLAALCLFLVACSHDRSGNSDGGNQKTCGFCNGIQFIPCTADGQQGTPMLCEVGQVCVDGVGCGACMPGGKTCVANEVHACGADGKPGDYVATCDDKSGVDCADGMCLDGCAAAATNASNVGCEFWAVDLDNELAPGSDAANAAWGIVVSNAGQATANVIIERNDALPGATPAPAMVNGLSLPPGTVQMVTLPTREVDGTTNGMNNGPGTFLSSNAYRIKSDVPLVVYQFNPLRQSFSNDASLLIPTNGLGTDHRVVGYPTARPFAIAGLTSHSFITIVGTQAGTTVKVQVSNATVAGGGVPALAKGATYTGTIGLFDVLNIESDGVPGDFTGSFVSASAPVAVFTGTEAALAPATANKPPPPPNSSGSSTCCTDHLEEQVWPVSSLGKRFVVTRSPIRSDDPVAYPGYDVIRFVGAAETATVTTNLAAPDNSFTLQPGQLHETFVDKDFVVEATQPIIVAQILVSGDYTDTNLLVGDPSLTIFPAVEQFRPEYLFLVPESYDTNYVVIAQRAADPPITIDGAALPASCVMAPAGTLAAIDYVARRCPVMPGAHKLLGANPFGIAAYGYYRYGSYAFIGGAFVKKIYSPPPIL